MHIRKSYYDKGGKRKPVPAPTQDKRDEMRAKGFVYHSPSIGYIKANEGARMPQGQMQGGPQGQGAPQDVEALLEMLSQIPPEVTVGEVIELIMGDKPGSMPPPSPQMQSMQ
jgi:hypothetical protein